MNIESTHSRQIFLDTETTGMNKFGLHYEGHCIIEIGAVEMINRRLTGNNFHVYIKPTRPVDPEAIKIHGITDEMLADKPDFSHIFADFIHFVEGAELIIHNAPFDVGFIDYEFTKLGKQLKINDICTVTDSLYLARQMYPGKRNSLDALCDRLSIDNSKRILHGALLDAEILADVYLAMTGGQKNLFDEDAYDIPKIELTSTVTQSNEMLPLSHIDLKLIPPTQEEYQAHLEYFQLLNKKSHNQCVWEKQNT